VAHEDRILSQGEIDSLLKKIMPRADEPTSSEKPEPAKQTEPSPPGETAKQDQAAASFKQTESLKPEEPTPPVPKVVSVKPTMPPEPETEEPPPITPSAATADRESGSDEINSLKKNVVDLSREVGKLTVALQTVTQLEERVKQLEAMLKQQPGSNEMLKSRIDKITNVIEVIRQKKSDSAFLQEFVCSKCHSKSLVAIYVKCTSCGKENWMGWWSEQDNE